MKHPIRALLGTVSTLTLFALAAPMQAAAQAPQPQAGPRPLRIMSYNIKHGQTNASCTQPPRIPGEPPFPDCNLDLQASIDVIRAHHPDIVGIQEVDRFWARSAYQDEPAVIAAGLGMDHYCYAPNLDHQPDTHADVPHQYGTVIVSRFPILECTNTLLRRTGTNEQRGLTRALINVRGVPLQFYNTHLHTTAADRLMQTADIAAVIDAAPDTPRFWSATSTRGRRLRRWSPIFARFLDAWLEAGAPTLENPNGNTSPSNLTGLPDEPDRLQLRVDRGDRRADIRPHRQSDASCRRSLSGRGRYRAAGFRCRHPEETADAPKDRTKGRRRKPKCPTRPALRQHRNRDCRHGIH